MKYAGFELDRFQREAITHLQEGRSVLVAAPTGTGKTIIADWIVEDALSKGQHVIYTAPVKALSNQKFRDYVDLHQEANVGLLTGDLVIRRDAPCRVMTTEVLRNMLLSEDPLDDLHAVILDEIHFLDDRERGTVWEEVLIYLPKHVLIVGLSATLPNLDQFAQWMSEVRQREVAVVQESVRHVPLRTYFASVDAPLVDQSKFEKIWNKKRGMFGQSSDQQKWRRGRQNGGGGRNQKRRRRNTRRTSHIHVFHMIRENDMMPYLYFVFSRRDTEMCARNLSQTLQESLLSPEEQKRSKQLVIQAAAELGGALDSTLMEMYSKGIAFHHAGVHVLLKALVEGLYESRLLKVLYTTSTFALGINMPARTVVFDGLKKFNGRELAPLTTRQFMQKAGRAGRRGMDSEGHVVLRVDLEDYSEVKPLLQQYQSGKYEAVRSSFNLSFYSVVNLLERYTVQQVQQIVEQSFLNYSLAHQAEKHLERASQIETSSSPTNRSTKEAKRLRKRAKNAGTRCWDEFQSKVRFLERIGYLGSEQSFNSGAKVLRHVQISEIFVTELILHGIFEDLDVPVLFGVLCGITGELPRHANRQFVIPKNLKRIHRDILAIRMSEPVIDSEALSGQATIWDPDYMVLGGAWATGKSLDELLMMVHTQTDIAGDLISVFRRAKDIASQLIDVYEGMDDRVNILRALITRVKRDEVEAIG